MITRCLSPDQPGWLELRIALWPDEETNHLEEMARFCAQPGRFAQFIAYNKDNKAEGLVEVALRTDYVNGTNSSPVAFLEGIFVAPGSRGRGIARALVREAERWARQQSCTEFASDSLLDNLTSHAMHRALGFEETERVVYFRKQISLEKQ